MGRIVDVVISMKCVMVFGLLLMCLVSIFIVYLVLILGGVIVVFVIGFLVSNCVVVVMLFVVGRCLCLGSCVLS